MMLTILNYVRVRRIVTARGRGEGKTVCDLYPMDYLILLIDHENYIQKGGHFSPFGSEVLFFP